MKKLLFLLLTAALITGVSNGQWVAYNDMQDGGGQTAALGNNATTHAYLDNDMPLVDFETGATLAATITGEVVGDGDTNGDSQPNNGSDCDAGTDADLAFGGILSLIGGHELDTTSEHKAIIFKNLDPSKTYNITLSQNRDNSAYTDRWTRVTIEGADSYVYASSAGANKLSEDSVEYCVGYNTVNGYVVKWTDVKCGADGSFSIKSEHAGYNGKGYAMSGVKLEEIEALKPVYPENGGWVVFDDPSIYLEWQRPDPNGPLPPAPYNVDVYLGTNNPLQAGDRIETNVDIDTTTNFGLPLLDATTYYWRVDTYEPNALTGGISVKEGPTWSFATVVPAAIFVDKAEVQVSEEGETSDSYTLTLSKEPAQPVTVAIEFPMVSPLDISVSASTDDIEEHTNDGEIESITSTDLELGREDAFPDQQLCGMRFNNIDIPTGATITSAYLEFTVDEADAGELSLNVFGELSPDVPDTFTTAANILSSRPRTVAEVQWLNLPDWTQAMVDAHDKQQTPDISSIISEITGQAGWMYGNSLVLMVESFGGTEGGRTSESYDGATGDHSDASLAPRLHIEWTLGTGATNFPVSWNSPVVLDDTNWDTGAVVTVTAIDDDILDTDPHTFNLPAHTVTSADAEWDGLPIDDVVVNILENECGAWDFAPYDFSTDCAIDIKDLAIFAEKFGTCSDPHFPALCEDAR